MRKNVILSACTVPNSPYLAKVAVKSTPGLPDLKDLPVEWLAWLDSPQMAVVSSGPGKRAR